MLKATNINVASTLFIQGKLTTPMQLERSDRDGCPLSPLLFLIVANALSMLITRAFDERLIKGVYVEETGEFYTHGQFTENTM